MWVWWEKDNFLWHSLKIPHGNRTIRWCLSTWFLWIFSFCRRMTARKDPMAGFFASNSFNSTQTSNSNHDKDTISFHDPTLGVFLKWLNIFFVKQKIADKLHEFFFVNANFLYVCVWNEWWNHLANTKLSRYYP